MDENESKPQIGNLTAILIPIWLVASVFGDELFGIIYFRNVEDAMGFSMGKSWWWIYQLVVTAIFILVAIVIVRLRSNNASNDR